MPKTLPDALRELVPGTDHPLSSAVVAERGRRRGRRRRTVVATALALVLVGVVAVAVAARPRSSSRVVTTAPPGPAPTTATTAAPAVLVPWSADPIVTCGGSISFPASALLGPRGAEAADTPAAAALRAALRDPRLPPNMSGSATWRLLAQTPTTAQFASGDGADRYEMTFALKDGQWSWNGSGSCDRLHVVEPGLETVSLSAGPGSAPTASSTEVAVSADVGSCGPGTSQQLIGPQVHYEPDRVLVTLGLERHVPGGVCAGVGMAEPVTIHLDEPLGNRAVYDAGVYPPDLITPAPGSR